MKKDLKEAKGITLIALIITIIILLILAGIATYSGIDTIRLSKFTKFKTELKIMQSEVNNWYQEYTDGDTSVLTKGEEISSNSTAQAQANKVFTSSASGLTNQEGYRYFSVDTIKNLGIEGVEQDLFINIEKRSVVSYEGYTYEGETYYTLNQIPDEIYNVEYEVNTNTPTFDVDVKSIGDNEWQINITNVNYDGNINKWNVKYRIEGEEEWKISDSMNFTIDKRGIYEFKIFNGNIETLDENIVKKPMSLFDMYKLAEEENCTNADGKCNNEDHLHIADEVNYNPGTYETVGEKDGKYIALPGVTGMDEGQNIGSFTPDSITQEFKVANNLSWKVLGTEGEGDKEHLILMSSSCIKNESDNEVHEIYLYGAKGCVNRYK